MQGNTQYSFNDNQYVGRIVWTPFGEMKLVEAALSRPKGLKLAVGLEAAQDTLTEEFDPGGGSPVMDIDTEITV